MNVRRTIIDRTNRWVGWAGLLAAVVGCGGPRIYPVKGKIVFEHGEVKLLSGSTLICQPQQDSTIQAVGEIKEDGSFKLQTLAKGELHRGTFAGTYRAWIHLSREHGSATQQLRKSGLDPRFLDPKATDLSFEVPAPAEVILTVMQGKSGAKPPGK